MNGINASSLFHFTRNFDTLKKILENGLRLSYSLEYAPKEVVQAYLSPLCPEDIAFDEIEGNVVIPMISFCDIPLMRTLKHRSCYGSYVIGLNKKAVITKYEKIINPVVYTHSPNLSDFIRFLGIQYSQNENDILKYVFSKAKEYSALSPERLDKDRNKINAEAKSFLDAKFLLGFFIGLIKPVSYGKKSYYDEREWRLFYPDNMYEQLSWKWSVSKRKFELKKNSWNDELNSYQNFFIQIPEEELDKYITHIIVKKEEDTDEMIRFILENEKLFGCDWKNKYSRYKLISKVMSMERIERDF